MRTISENEMDRRKLLARAHGDLIQTMGELTDETGGLTPLEWCQVLIDCQQRIITHGLQDEWADGPSDSSDSQ